jgi:hypothetical protein
VVLLKEGLFTSYALVTDSSKKLKEKKNGLFSLENGFLFYIFWEDILKSAKKFLDYLITKMTNVQGKKVSLL